MTDTSKCGKLYGVGIGPGDPGLLTLRARDVLCSVDVVFNVAGPRSRRSISGGVVDAVEGCTARRRELIFSMAAEQSERETAWSENACLVIGEIELGNDVAFVTLGDPLIYSTFGYLRKEVLARLPQSRIEVIPGITSFQAAAALTGDALVEDREILTVIPSWDGVAPNEESLAGADTAVLLKTYKHRNRTLDLLTRSGSQRDIVYASRVGLDGQLLERNPDRVAELPPQYLSLLIAKRRKRG